MPSDISTILQDILIPQPPSCDNCFEVHQQLDFFDDRCAVRMLLTWADIGPFQAAERYHQISSIALWDALTPVIDRMVAGEFDIAEVSE